jgi:hypothetical protein
MMNSRGQVYDLDNVIARGRRFINLVSTSEQSTNFTADDYFHGALQACVKVSRVKVGNSRRAIGHEMLADKWLVSPEVARCTLERTTQRGGGRFPTHLFLVVFEQTIDNSATSAFDMMCLPTRCSRRPIRAKGSFTHRSTRPVFIGVGCTQ